MILRKSSLFLLILFATISCSRDNCDSSKDLECTNFDISSENKPIVLPIYMDYQATTPIDPRVLQEMNYVESNVYGNPNSIHKLGKEAMKIGARTDEIIFTSGATESNNLALKGFVETYAKKTGRRHIITSMTEHACIQETCKKLESNSDIDITYLCPKSNGLIDLKELEEAITPNTLMISIMGVNNEIGVIQDL